MFHWLRDHRRKEILKEPFPVKWREILEERVTHYSFLNSDEKIHLEQLVQVFEIRKSITADIKKEILERIISECGATINGVGM